MTLSKNIIASAAIMIGAATGVNGQPQPGQAPLVKLPESHNLFYKTLEKTPFDITASEVVSRLDSKPAMPMAPRRMSQTSALQPAASISSQSNIYGYLYFFQSPSLVQGLYRLNATPTPTFLWTDYYTDYGMTMSGGWIRNGHLCGLNQLKYMGGLLAYGHVELDLATGEVIDWQSLPVESGRMDNIYLTTAYRDMDDMVYGYGFNSSGEGYAFKSAEATDINGSFIIREVEFNQVCAALCYNLQDDMFYGVTTQGKFVAIDNQGNQTEVFDLALPNLDTALAGLAYSPKDNAFVFNAYFKDGKTAIYSIDSQAKTVSKLYDCANGENYIYMVCADDNVKPTAPAKPRLDKCEFTDAALSGKLTYTLPARTAGNSAISGNMTWRLMIDGVQAKTGSAPAGSQVTVNTDELTNGSHYFAFSCTTNSNDYSMPDTFRKWIGNDYPVKPANVNLTHTKLTWEPVSESVNNGYLDVSALKYDVYINNQRKGQTAGTSFDITLPEGEPFTSYTAMVMATANGKTSDPGISNYITYGEPLVPAPSISYYPQEEEFKLFQAIDIDGKLDSEGNPRNWHFSTTMGFPSFASGADGDDLLVFPPINFSNTEKAYRFQMEAGLIHDRDNTGTIEVWLGKEPTVEAMTQCIIPPTRLYHMLGDMMTEYFAVSEPGTYYIGVRTKTNQVGMHISLLDVSLTDRAADVPTAVTNLAVVPGADGALTANVTFTMPTKTANGKTIPETAELTATVTSREFVLNKPSEGTVKATKTIKGAPGSTQTVEIETIQNLNTIGVSCAIDGRMGTEMTTTVYTGLSKPYIVQNLKAVVDEDNMGVHLTWTPPVEADDDSNGPIGDTFYYSVWYYADGWQFLDGVGYDVLEADVSFEPGQPQTAVTIGIMAMNAAGQSEHITSVSSIIGTPYELPIVEDFPGGYETYEPIMIQRPSQEYQGTYWMVDDPANVSAIFANPSKVAYIGYIGDENLTSARSRLSLPKFSTMGVSDVKISLTYWGGRFNAELSLLANCYGLATPAPLGTYPAGDGWVTNTIALADDFLDKKWVELFLDAKYTGKDNSFAMFSGYSISGIAAIDGIAAGAEGTISCANGMLHVAGFAGQPLVVSDVAGRVVLKVDALDDISGFAIAPGMYIVKAGTTTRKIVVK